MPRRGDQHSPRHDDDLKAGFEGNERANTPTRVHEWRDPEVGAPEPGKNSPLEPGAAETGSQRTEADVRLELDEVRERRREMFPTQAEPLAPESPIPAGFVSGIPGGEITELLEREAGLVLELAGIARAQGVGPDADLRAQEETARRVLRRIQEERP